MDRSIVLLFLCLYVGCGLGAVKWPKLYYLEGVKMDLIQHSVLPFKLWIDDDNWNVRTETYGGEINTYTTGMGETYMFHYKADKSGNANMVCSEIYMDASGVEPLPDISEFKLTGKLNHEGKRVEEWSNIEDFFSRRYEETMYVTRNKPVKYWLKIFDTQSGALEKYNVIIYHDFTKKVNHQEFEFDNSTCAPMYPIDDYGNTLNDYDPDHPADLAAAFARHQKYHGMKPNKHEHEMRKAIFKENWRMVNEHNSKNLGYKLALNKFADRTPTEMKRINAIKPHKPRPGTHAFPHTEAELEAIVEDIPEEFDWRTLGTVSRVKSQGNCGSCWAFATTASIEGALAVKYGTNFDLSEQSIVDCAWPYKVYGCDGGYSERAMQYVHDHGIPTEEEYGEYLQMDGQCHINNMTRIYKLTGFVAVTPMSINALKTAVYKYGPIAVYVYVDGPMAMYTSGIFNEVLGYERPADYINHVVVVVGYGVQNGELYWIVKNSYGQDWGMDGYILIAAKDNTGNVLFAPYYPLV